MSISKHVYLRMEWLPSGMGVFSSIFSLHSGLCALLEDSLIAALALKVESLWTPTTKKEVRVLLVIKGKHQPICSTIMGYCCGITVACTEKWVIHYLSTLNHNVKFKYYLRSKSLFKKKKKSQFKLNRKCVYMSYVTSTRQVIKQASSTCNNIHKWKENLV